MCKYYTQWFIHVLYIVVTFSWSSKAEMNLLLEKPTSCGFSVFVCSCVKWQQQQQQQCMSGGPSSVVISVAALTICLLCWKHLYPGSFRVFKQLLFYADVTNAYAWFHGAAPSFPRTSEGPDRGWATPDLSADDRQATLESHIRLLLLCRGGRLKKKLCPPCSWMKFRWWDKLSVLWAHGFRSSRAPR